MGAMGQPEPAGSDSSVLRKKVTPEEEVAQLRRSMIQHLTASGKLLQAIFAIDREYFGSRFHGAEQAEDSAADPFKELALATKVVETLGEELQGAAAFADSPVMREMVALLVANVDEARGPAMELERLSLEAVGLPGDPKFAARTFPHNNPLACITEAAGFVQEMHWLIKRAIDRVGAMKLMLNESERQDAVAGAGSGAGGIRNDELTAVLTTELKARELELKTLREQVAAFQEQSANDRKKTEAALEAELESAVIELERERDMRVSDHAEVRSLAVEIERLAAIEYEAEKQAANPDVNLDDLRNSLASLREKLKGDSADAITVAADAVLIAWFRLNAQQATAHAAEIAVLRTRERVETPAADRSRDATKAMEAELERLRAQAHNEAAEAARLRSDLVQFGNLSQDYVREKERAKEAAAAAAAELAKAKETIAAARQKERQLEIELGKLRDAQAQAGGGGAEARANEDLRKQLADAANELAKLREVARERDALHAQMEEQRRASSVATEKARSETGEIRAHAQSLRDQIMKAQEAQDALSMERDALRSRLDDLRKSTETASQATTSEQGKLTKELTVLRDAEAKLRGQAAAAANEKDRLQGRLDQAERELHESREHLAARAREHAQALEQLRAREAMARDHSRASNDELAQTKSVVSRLESELKLARDKIAAMTATSEQLRQQNQRANVELERERDRIKSAADHGEAAKLRELLQQAREAVKQAKSRQESADAADRAIIADLLKQIEDLKKRAKTEKA